MRAAEQLAWPLGRFGDVPLAVRRGRRLPSEAWSAEATASSFESGRQAASRPTDGLTCRSCVAESNVSVEVVTTDERLWPHSKQVCNGEGGGGGRNQQQQAPREEGEERAERREEHGGGVLSVDGSRSRNSTIVPRGGCGLTNVTTRTIF